MITTQAAAANTTSTTSTSISPANTREPAAPAANTIAQPKRTKHISATDTAKIIREELARAFPGVTFSVRTHKYSGGASIDIGWMDGPTEEQVDRLTSPFRGADFDGMTDCKNYVTGEYRGEPVHFGADYIQAHRRLSRVFLEKITAAYCKQHGCPQPEVLADRYGAYFDHNQPIAWERDHLGNTLTESIMLKARTTPAADYRNVPKIAPAPARATNTPAPARESEPAADLEPGTAVLYTDAATGVTWLKFASKPDLPIRNSLVRAGWHWGSKRGAWWTNKRAATPPAGITYTTPGNTSSGSEPEEPTPAQEPASESESESTNTSGKIPATSIAFPWREGRNTDIDAPVFTGPDCWQRAQARLDQWLAELPAGGSRKIGFSITWADGQTYTGKLETIARSWGNDNDLALHIIEHNAFHAGLWVPVHMSPEDTSAMVAFIGEEERAKCERVLDTYQIGPAPTPAAAAEESTQAQAAPAAADLEQEHGTIAAEWQATNIRAIAASWDGCCTARTCAIGPGRAVVRVAVTDTSLESTTGAIVQGLTREYTNAGYTVTPIGSGYGAMYVEWSEPV